MRHVAAILLPTLLALAACSAPPAGPEERFELRGTVVSVDADRQRVKLDHEPIPGYMDAMTMEFRVKDARMLPALLPGKLVTADLVVAGGSSWIENIVVSSPAGVPSLPSRVEGATEPTPGAPAPGFALVDHESKPATLERYRGKAVALTFIYTRCPLPDYCPLMTSNFAAVRRELSRDPKAAARIQLLSITIDPEFDTPEVLARYAREFATDETGRVPENWAFLTGPPDQVREAAHAYGLVFETVSGTIDHSLRTAVIAPDGRLVKVYRGNEWQPEALAAELVRTAG
jgi:protein SCO1/2